MHESGVDRVFLHFDFFIMLHVEFILLFFAVDHGSIQSNFVWLNCLNSKTIIIFNKNCPHTHPHVSPRLSFKTFFSTQKMMLSKIPYN